MKLGRPLIKTLKRKVMVTSRNARRNWETRRFKIKVLIKIQSKRNDLKQLNKDTENPNNCNFLKRIKLLTLSKALEKSVYIYQFVH